MRKWFRNFFAVDNEINENTVIGTILTIVLIVLLFSPEIEDIKIYTTAGLVAGFFCLNIPKR